MDKKKDWIYEDLLECALTEKELLDRGNSLSLKQQERDHLEKEKKAVTSSLGAKINAVVAEIGTLALAISSRKETRNVKCEKKWNTPTEGQVTIFRHDTKEVVKIMVMTDSEKKDLRINKMGDQEDKFVFVDKRGVPLIPNTACSQADADKWQSMGLPQEKSSLIEAPLDPKAIYRVIKGESGADNSILYQLQKLKEGEKPAPKAKKGKKTE